MKGIILAGGSGKRLHPLTIAVSKQLLPVYDKPMIFYPLTTLIQAGIKEILIITSPVDQHLFQKLLGDGSQWGANLCYEIQESPNGIAEAFLIAEDFVEDSDVALILGDNMFFGKNFNPDFTRDFGIGARIFVIETKQPEKYGVIDFDDKGKPLSIEEKPKNPKTKFAITGLYLLDNRVSKIAKTLTPSSRGELEIVDVLQNYLQTETLELHILGKDDSWLDMGNADSLLEASLTVKAMREQGYDFLGNPGSNPF